MKIGLEVHVSLPTKTKLFCRCKTYVAEPNTAICPICTGMPGSKPMLNKAAISQAMGIAKALNCKINSSISFVRKIYFYPDLPKSYQVTQKELAIGSDGFVSIQNKKIHIRRVQLEEDPAKILREDNYTLIDYNRSGQPLVEIVTEPDISSEEELKIFMNELRSILYYLDVDINQEMKADLNISLLDNRVEIKNVTGIKNLIDALEYESKRQQKLIDLNQTIEKETRSYSEAKLATISSREKETDEEYGFIFDPDLNIYNTTNINIKEPVYASAIAAEYSKKYNVKESQILEAIQFNKDSLIIIQNFSGKYQLKDILNTLSLVQRYGTKTPSFQTVEKVLGIIKTGNYPTQSDIRSIEAGKEIDINPNAVNTEDIDKEIRMLLNENKHLIKEYESNKKVLNFIIGAVVKKYKVNPRIISERLEALLTEYLV